MPYYCSKEHQKEHWKNGHKKVCYYSRLTRAKSKPTKSVDYLYKAVSDDMLPALSSVVQVDYGFRNCKTEQEESKLLGLYTGLISASYLATDLDALHEACMQAELAEFIKKRYTELLERFLENEHIVKNPYPLP